MELNALFDFLKRLEKNNNREWFAENREEYEYVRGVFSKFVESLIVEIAKFDSSVMGLDVKDTIFRIYRDTRFSADKTPYKTHFAAFIAVGGRKSIRGGYYLHLQPGECGIAGGIYGAQPEVQKALRKSVFENIDEFLEIVKNPAFEAYYKEMYGEKLKTVPRPFPKDFSHAEWLKPKHYCVDTIVSDDFFCRPDSIQQTANIMKLLYPFNRFLNFAVDELYGL